MFTDRSLWTMIHGIGLGGTALMMLFAALFSLWTLRAGSPDAVSDGQARRLTQLLVFTATVLWATVLVGTYVIFPPYRATPPAGLADLGQYPRFLIDSKPDTAWLHAFAMESKEHMPWIAAMLATAVAFVAARYQSALLADARLRGMSMTLLAIVFALASFTGLMGIFVNKVAPLQ